MDCNEVLIARIRQKKELRGIAEEVVRKALERYQVRHRVDFTGFSSAQTKQLVKDIRKELRFFSGRFNVSFAKRQRLLAAQNYQGLLKTHTSTAERLEDYPYIRKKITMLKPRSILDLGCGLNPIALARPGIFYYALDINQEDLQLVAEFFQQEGVHGTTKVYDLREIAPGDLPPSDLCLLLKILDVIEKRGHKLAERILQTIKTRYFLISFSTKTLSGKPMNHPQRGWIIRLVERLGYQYEEIKLSKEIYYLVKKRFHTS